MHYYWYINRYCITAILVRDSEVAIEALAQAQAQAR
jgi:hypothetical protein